MSNGPISLAVAAAVSDLQAYRHKRDSRLRIPAAAPHGSRLNISIGTDGEVEFDYAFVRRDADAILDLLLCAMVGVREMRASGDDLKVRTSWAHELEEQQ